MVQSKVALRARARARMCNMQMRASASSSASVSAFVLHATRPITLSIGRLEASLSARDTKFQTTLSPSYWHSRDAEESVRSGSDTQPLALQSEIPLVVVVARSTPKRLLLLAQSARIECCRRRRYKGSITHAQTKDLAHRPRDFVCAPQCARMDASLPVSGNACARACTLASIRMRVACWQCHCCCRRCCSGKGNCNNNDDDNNVASLQTTHSGRCVRARRRRRRRQQTGAAATII